MPYGGLAGSTASKLSARRGWYIRVGQLPGWIVTHGKRGEWKGERVGASVRIFVHGKWRARRVQKGVPKIEELCFPRNICGCTTC